MSQTALREVEHEITVRAPARAAYGLIADVGNWPRLCPPSIHVERLDLTGSEERIRIWATANGEVKSWISRRVLDPGAMRIGFRQEVPSAPVASMGGTWIVEPVTADESRVRLLHDFRAVDDDPESLVWIEQAVNRNSKSELAALKGNAELATGATALVTAFEDTVAVKGSAADVYAFLNEAQLWSKRLPHVVRASLAEEEPGVQLLEMDTQTTDGSTHTTKSVRVCFPHRLIAYKQIGLPALMTAHLGQWRIKETPDDVRVTSEHTVVINEENISAVLGPDADVAQATRFVRDALSTNSLATLRHAKAYAERR